MLANLWHAVARGIVEASHGAIEPTIRSASPPTPNAMATDSLTAEAVFHDAARTYLDQQVSANDRLDTRSAQSFQVGSTVVTIAFGLLSLSREQIPDRAEYSLWGALGAYGLVLIFCLAASVFRRMAYQPDIHVVRGYVDVLSGDDLQLWVALEYLASIQDNERRVAWKTRFVGAATVCLYVEGACLAVAALFTLL